MRWRTLGIFLKSLRLHLLVAFMFLPTSLHAFDDKDTHPRITERAVAASSLNLVLGEQLRMPNGVGTALTGPFGLSTNPTTKTITILLWLRGGAQFEDEGTCHATQHFHNPMKSFTESGVSDLHFGALLWWTSLLLPPPSPDQLVRVAMRPWCLSQIRGYLPNVTAIHSAVRWGTRYTDPTTKGAAPGRQEG